MTGPDPNSKRSRCLAVLADGPSTTGEVAAETGIAPKLVSTHLGHLFDEGKVTRKPFGSNRSGRGYRWLWSAAA